MNTKIPMGYMQNAKGDLVREENIKEIDKIKDQVANDLAKEALEINARLTAFKRRALDDIRDIIEVAACDHGVKMGGEKGNTTLMSYDGRFKIQRSYADVIAFGPELEVAKELFTRYFDEITVGFPPEAKVLVDNAFRRNAAGQLKTGKLLELLTYGIEHEVWLKACAVLKSCMIVNGKAVYIRVYERVNDSDVYNPITLDLASAEGGYGR